MIFYIGLLAIGALVGLYLYRTFWGWIQDYVSKGTGKWFVQIIVFAAVCSTLVGLLHITGWAVGGIAYLLSLV